MTKTIDKTAPLGNRGDCVEIHEPNRQPWTGRVRSVKWSPISGWWYEIDTDDSTGTWCFSEGADMSFKPGNVTHGTCSHCGLPIENGYAEVGGQRFHDESRGFDCYRQWNEMKRCEWSDLDAAAGACNNCGEAFWSAPDATLAVEQHYQKADVR